MILEYLAGGKAKAARNECCPLCQTEDVGRPGPLQRAPGFSLHTGLCTWNALDKPIEFFFPLAEMAYPRGVS